MCRGVIRIKSHRRAERFHRPGHVRPRGAQQAQSSVADQFGYRWLGWEYPDRPTYGERLRLYRSHCGRKPVSGSRYCLDVLGSATPGEYFSQCGDVHSQDSFLDTRVRPHDVEQLLFADKRACTTHQRDEHLVHLRRKRHGTARLREPALTHIEHERSELVRLHLRQTLGFPS
jgi:hypothetical protein